MEKKIKIGLVVLISIIILIILFSSNKIFIKKDVQIEAQNQNENLILEDDLAKLEKQISNLIKQANYCDIDGDCIISTSHYIQSDGKYCSFGCYDLFNKNADLSQIESAIGKYYLKYGPCANYDCPEIPTQSDIICGDNKCVDSKKIDVIRCGNGILEVEYAEQCDGSDLDSQTCVTQGFESGVLGCTSDCKFDASDCVKGDEPIYATETDYPCETVADCPPGPGCTDTCPYYECTNEFCRLVG